PATAQGKPGGADRGQGEVQPEHETPSTCARRSRSEGRSVQRAEDASRLLQRGHRAEGDRAPAVSVQVGGKRQGERHQPPAADAWMNLPATSQGSPAKSQSPAVAVIAEPTAKAAMQAA